MVFKLHSTPKLQNQELQDTTINLLDYTLITLQCNKKQNVS